MGPRWNFSPGTPRRPSGGPQVLSNDLVEMDERGLGRVAKFLECLRVRRGWGMEGKPADGFA